MIFGRKNCNYNKDWAVVIHLLAEKEATIAEQLRRTEAVTIYNQIVKKLKDNADLIEVQYDGQYQDEKILETFIKNNILSVEIKLN